MSEDEIVFEALAHEARRHLVALLGHLGGELSSGYLARHFQHSWPTTTRHLKVLEHAGIVTVRREGRSSYYRLDRDRLRRVVGGWLQRTEQLKGPTDEDLSRDDGSDRSRRSGDVLRAAPRRRR